MQQATLGACSWQLWVQWVCGGCSRSIAWPLLLPLLWLLPSQLAVAPGPACEPTRLTLNLCKHLCGLAAGRRRCPWLP